MHTKLASIQLRILKFQIWSSYASSTCGQSSLTGWWVSLTLIELGCHLWRMFTLGCSPYYKYNLLLHWAPPPIGMKVLFLAQVLLITFHEDRIHLIASFSFISIKTQWDLRLSPLDAYNNHRVGWEAGKMIWGGSLEHSLSKKEQ